MQSRLQVCQRWDWDWWLDITTGTGVPAGVNPLLLLLHFQSIVGMDKDKWKSIYGLIWSQIRRKASDRICFRYIRRLCQKYGRRSIRGKVQPEEVANLDSEIKNHLILLGNIPAFIKNERGSQHQNVVRYIYGKYFLWYGRTRYMIDVMKSTRIEEESKDAYSKVAKTLLSRVKDLLKMIEEEGTMTDVYQAQSAEKEDSPSQALKYF